VEQQGENRAALTVWDPVRSLCSVAAEQVRYSRGFLRCRPEKWFPGFAMQWLPLMHSLGIELKFCEIKPLIQTPGQAFGFAGTVDGEPLGMVLDEDSVEILLEAVAPAARSKIRRVVLEYLARRLLTSLAISWSGPESSTVQFDTELDVQQIRASGAVKMVLSANGQQAMVWLMLGPVLVDKLDGLWRRQLHATSRQSHEAVDVHLEFAHLTVPPALLATYLKPGTTVDLEVPVSDAVLMVSASRPLMTGRLLRCGDYFAIESSNDPLPVFQWPIGTTRLAVELGQMHWEGTLVREMSQPGAMCDTGIQIGDRVSMTINGEQVAEAVLRTYQGRLVVSVL